MGNNRSSIQINLDRPQPATYYAGELLSGQVQLVLGERISGLRYIYLHLTGDVAFTRTRTARIMNGQTERISDSYEVRILNQKIILNSSVQRGQHQNYDLPELSRHDSGSMGPGQYQYSFSIRLPDVLPPTLHPEECPFVRYKLQVLVETSWYVPDINCQCPIRIHPNVNLFDIPNVQSVLKFNKTEKDITVKGLLPRAGFEIGDRTSLFLEILNPRRVLIKQVDVCLVQHYSIDQCRRRTEMLHATVPNLHDNSDESIEAQCSIRFPTDLPPTYTFASRPDSSGFQVDVYYDLKLEVKLKKLFSDFYILVPIILGTKSADLAEFHRTTPGARSLSPMPKRIEPRCSNLPNSPPPYESLFSDHSAVDSEYYE